jgi:NADH-quinone oxidoreductase subunit H
MSLFIDWLRGLMANWNVSGFFADIIAAVVAGFVIFSIIGLSVMALVWLERKISAHLQSRLGPMRTGPHGTLQLLADILKLVTKEDLIPANADKVVFIVAPFVVLVPVVLTFLVIPINSNLVVRDLNIGLLYFLAIPSLSGVGLIMAGWGSRSKYSVLGAMRAAAQFISYEIPRALAVVGVVMFAGSLSTVAIASSQAKIWNIIWQPLGFVVFFIASLAESNRLPFDLPEGEAELVAGFHTEYSGARFALFFMAEYGHLVAASAMTAVLFLGGGSGFLLPSVVWFFLKVVALIVFIMWIRWTYPRFRPDQLMSISWKILIPLALVNLAIAGTVTAFL